MNSDGEGDSRTATVGRKRQRGAEEQDTSTPAEKKTRTESEEEGEIDSHYSPSPEVHLDWDSREANQPTATTRRSPSESGEASRSPSPESAMEFPHTSSAPVASAAASGSNASYGLDGAGDDPARAEVEQTSQGTSASSVAKSSSVVQLAPDQVKTIEKFEQKRAQQILRSSLPSAKEMKDKFAYAVVSIPIETKQKGHTVPKKTTQVSFIRWIGKVAPTGLLGVYFKGNHDNSKNPIFQALVLYRNNSYLAYLKIAVEESKTPFFWDGFDFKPEMTMSKPSGISEFGSNPNAKKKSLTTLPPNRPHLIFSFGAALAHASEYLIRSGALLMEHHDAFQPGRGAVLHPDNVKHQEGRYGFGYIGELAEVNERPLQAWALTSLSDGAAFSGSTANGELASTDDPGVGSSATAVQPPVSTIETGSVSAISTAAGTPRTSGAAPSEAGMSTEQAQGPAAEEWTVLAQLSPPECELQIRYFGAADPNDPVHCLTCGKKGHMADVCPSRTCQFCQAVDLHFSNQCPTRTKCRKCRERGHKMETCTAKLFRSKLDGIVCDLCQSRDHFEEECTWVWRTFDPNQLPHVNKVERLSMGCYFCGSDGHWGDDCRQRPRGTTHKLDVFSAKEADRYLIDPSARPANRTGNGGFSIKGTAHSNPIDLDEDDDADDMANFYRNTRPRNNGGPERGNIRINAGGNQRNNERRPRSPPSTRHHGNNNNNNNNNYYYYYYYRQRNDNHFQPINNGYHAQGPGSYGPPVSASRGGGGGRGGNGQVLGRGGARNGRGGCGGGRGGGNGGGGRGRGDGGNNRAPPPPPPPAASSSSSSRARGGLRKNRNKK